MERLTERTTDGILVKENHGENGLRTFYQCFEEKPNDKYTNCDGGYCAIEKLAAYEDAEEQGQYGKWIPVSERLPEEKESFFAKFKNTDKWKKGMFEKTSSTVIVTICDDRENRRTATARTFDGRWKSDFLFKGDKITAWMPLPEPYRGSEGK